MAEQQSSVTRLQQWMDEHGVDVDQLAGALDESYGRIAHYVRRGAIPKPEMVRKLSAHTGLPAEAFLFPYDAPNERATA